MARIGLDHPLLVALAEKRRDYLARGKHGEAHGIATARSIVWTWLTRQAEPIPTASLHSGFAPLVDVDDLSAR